MVGAQTANKKLQLILEQAGKLDDANINLATVALAMAAYDNPLVSSDISLERYQNHIKSMIEEVAARHALLLKEGAEDDARTQLAALKHILADKYYYRGDTETYDDLQNVNLIRVIERRKGMPISISLLYLHVGLAQGWALAALNFPAHVVCRIEKDGQRILFDPFNQCVVLQAADLRKLLKTLVGAQAELRNEYYEASTKREVLIRLQNNIKLRLIEAEDYGGAVNAVEIMRMIDPQEYRLLLDAGVLYARIGQPADAIIALKSYIERAPSPQDRDEAQMLLRQIRTSLN